MKASEERGESTDKTKFPWVGLVRLFAAVLGSVIASFFLRLYTHFSRIRLQIEHPNPNEPLTPITWQLIELGWWVFAFPIAAFVLGIVLLRMRPKSILMMEALVSAIWLISLLMVVLPILSWQIENIPTLSGLGRTK